MLTRVIAGRLPARDYMAVRVELRDVPADTDLQSQIEYAIRDATGESLGWPGLARSAGGALPVVLLDGFDELLQATGIGQTDYLEQIVRFQEREADQGRPVAVIITSRTAVADRARLPACGAVAVRLEPFSEEQVRRWLAIWNASNAAYLATRGLQPLSADAVLRQPALASQPLLLLMLALYDADDNALQRHAAGLGEADVYERILTRFAERELRKTQPGIEAEPLRAAVEAELLRLSVAAFAMFNRGRQWVTHEELSADLTALFGPATRVRPQQAFMLPQRSRSWLSGGFFSSTRRRPCATAHPSPRASSCTQPLASSCLPAWSCGTRRPRRSRCHPQQAGYRRRLPACPAVIRSPYHAWHGHRVPRCAHPQLSGHTRGLLRGLLLAAFHDALQPRADSSYDRYRPGHVSAPARHAAYSANLLLLIALIGGPVTGRELFPDGLFPASDWRHHAMLWRSQFTAEGRKTWPQHCGCSAIWHAGDREIRVSLEPWSTPRLDPFWTFMIPRRKMRKGYGWCHISAYDIRKESYFVCDTADDIIWHGLEPIVFEMDQRAREDEYMEATTAFGILSEERAVSVTHAMTRLWLASGDPAEPRNCSKPTTTA